MRLISPLSYVHARRSRAAKIPSRDPGISLGCPGYEHGWIQATVAESCKRQRMKMSSCLPSAAAMSEVCRRTRIRGYPAGATPGSAPANANAASRCRGTRRASDEMTQPPGGITRSNPLVKVARIKILCTFLVNAMVQLDVLPDYFSDHSVVKATLKSIGAASIQCTPSPLPSNAEAQWDNSPWVLLDGFHPTQQPMCDATAYRPGSHRRKQEN